MVTNWPNSYFQELQCNRMNITVKAYKQYLYVNPLAERILLDGTNFLCGIFETVYSTNNNRNGLSLSGLTVRITLRWGRCSELFCYNFLLKH